MLNKYLENAKEISIFSDGACSGNPGPGGWGAIIYIDRKYVLELGGGDFQTTNNKMEMTAVAESLKALHQKNSTLFSQVRFTVYTDSRYLIQGITAWIFGWKNNSWKTKEGNPVANQDLWMSLDEQVRKIKTKINWQYVPGHSGFPGNERCDEIAVAFSKGLSPHLFSGDRSDYHVNLDLEISEFQKNLIEQPKKPNKKNQKAYSYLSLVYGKVERHETWESCQARVHGVPNAKFKKAISAADEEDILKSWGQ